MLVVSAFIPPARHGASAIYGPGEQPASLRAPGASSSCSSAPVEPCAASDSSDVPDRALAPPKR
jgi:hypothetical protein